MIRHSAVILAGGMSRRMGHDKAAAIVHGRPQLTRTLEAVDGAEHIVVVGPSPRARDLSLGRAVANVAGAPVVGFVEERPRFAGPLAALAAGVAALPGTGSPQWALLLGCDLVHPAVVVTALRSSLLEAANEDGVVLTNAGRPNWVAAAYRTDPLRLVLASLSSAGDLTGLPLRAISGKLKLRMLPIGLNGNDFDTPAQLLEHLSECSLTSKAPG